MLIQLLFFSWLPLYFLCSFLVLGLFFFFGSFFSSWFCYVFIRLAFPSKYDYNRLFCMNRFYEICEKDAYTTIVLLLFFPHGSIARSFSSGKYEYDYLMWVNNLYELCENEAFTTAIFLIVSLSLLRLALPYIYEYDCLYLVKRPQKLCGKDATTVSYMAH
jgi:hypothetical protein